MDDTKLPKETEMKRLQDFSRYEKEKFNELRGLLKLGRLPSYLINPSIILRHNETAPVVAQLDENSEISLDRLITLAASDGAIGVNCRASVRGAIRKVRKVHRPEEELEIKHDPSNNKIHIILDEKED